MVDPLKEDCIIKHLSQTLNATRDELKGLSCILNDKQFDMFIAEIGKMHPGLCIREPGTQVEWYYLRPASLKEDKVPVKPGLTKGRASDLLAAVIGDR
jgi:hypothetical protein